MNENPPAGDRRGGFSAFRSDLAGLLQSGAAGVGDQAGDDVRVHVGVRATVFEVALALDLDLPGQPDRGAAVGDAVGELAPRGGLVRAGQAVLDVRAVAVDVLEE